MKFLIFLWLVVLVILHNDFWNWTDKTLVFGIFPLGLFYHGCYAIVAAITLFAMTRLIWPKHLDEEEKKLPAGKGGHP